MNERDVLFTKNITELMLKVMLASGDTQMQAKRQSKGKRVHASELKLHPSPN